MSLMHQPMEINSEIISIGIPGVLMDSAIDTSIKGFRADSEISIRHKPQFSFENSGHHPEAHTSNMAQTSVQEIAFLLLPGSALTCLSSAINVLRHANQLAGESLYRWRLFSADGMPVLTEEGFEIGVHYAITHVDPASLDKLIVCGGQQYSEQSVIRWLNRAGGMDLCIGALGQGSYPLARAGLLDGYRCTIHWEYLASLQEDYPNLELCSQLFVIDRDRFSCSGGSGVQDLMLHMVGMETSGELALAVSEVLVCGIRLPGEPQRVTCRQSSLGYAPPRLQEAVLLMESNIEEPLSLQELAELLDISRRQLERLFRKYLNNKPSRYYMALRLNRARQLLQQTNKSIVEVSIACGFSTASHFSKSIKEHFGCSPRLLCLQRGFSSSQSS